VLFPSMDDSQVIDVNDEETKDLIRTLIDGELELSRALITAGQVREARGKLMDVRSAAHRIKLLPEIVMIDDLLMSL